MKALVFGEVLWDIIEGNYHLGGAPLNFAAHVVQCGQESAIVSCLGTDSLGEEALIKIKNMRVDTSLIQKSEKPTGTVPVKLTDGQPEYHITADVAFDYVNGGNLDLEKIKNCDAFYFGSLIQRHHVSAQALYFILDNFSFKKVFYDVNLRKDCYNQAIIEKSLSYCTMLKVNDDEVEVISQMLYGEKMDFEAFSRQVCEVYPKIEIVIITTGKEGSLIFQAGQLHKVPGVEVKVKDTVGAGDSFSAAFLCSYFRTSDPILSATIANRVGGYVASSSGPIPGYPDDLLKLLS